MAKTDFPPASFTPPMLGYTGQGAFRYWCQTALPLVYDDSLSYYELLNKVVVYLNNVISDVGATETNVESLLTAYNQLQEYVNTYFTNIDIQEEINIGELGSRLQNRFPDFDVRNYGYSKLSQLLAYFKSLSLRQVGSTILVSKKSSDSEISAVKKQLEILVGNNGARGYNLGELNKQLCAKIPEFNVKNYGYTKFSRFMENLDGFTVKNNNVFIDNDD